jgi:ribonucleoside-diphosphate reductase alpha chain
MRTLEARYLRRDAAGGVAETPRELFLRVARTLAGAESNYGARPDDVEQWAQKFYAAMAGGLFLPNSPTLMNAGRVNPMLSACFVLPIEDSIEGIFESVKHTAQIQKAGGGTGFSFDRLRPTGDYISSSGGKTSGPMSFWRVFSEATRAIQQGAFRRGANMGMMSIDHPDILKFITAKTDLSAFENFNISIKVGRAFMEGLRRDGREPHVVVNPHTGRRYFLPRGLDVANYTIGDLIPAGEENRDATLFSSTSREHMDGNRVASLFSRQDVWDMIVRGAWATGEPGLCFIDRVNEDNPTPHLGRIEATNPCGEQPLLDYEACNLGSIDISKFVRNGSLDEGALREMIRLGVRMLDDVIDVNDFVIPQIENRCRGNRKIGLGIMGLADAMFELGIKYDSQQGLEFGRRIARLLTEEAFAASEELSVQRGKFPNWHGSIWQARGRAMRNAAVTTIAPTGTLSILAGCSGGIEPVFALAFYRHILGGQEMLEVNGPFMRYAKRQGIWSDELARKVAGGAKVSSIAGLVGRAYLPDTGRREPGESGRYARPTAGELFVTSYDVAPSWHVRMQAIFQEYIDGAISKTINMPNWATVADVDKVYQLAFDLRCKGVTVYRDGCRAGQPMVVKEQAGICPQCRGTLATEKGCSRCPHCGCTLCSL